MLLTTEPRRDTLRLSPIASPTSAPAKTCWREHTDGDTQGLPANAKQDAPEQHETHILAHDADGNEKLAHGNERHAEGGDVRRAPPVGKLRRVGQQKKKKKERRAERDVLGEMF